MFRLLWNRPKISGASCGVSWSRRTSAGQLLYSRQGMSRPGKCQVRLNCSVVLRQKLWRQLPQFRGLKAVEPFGDQQFRNKLAVKDPI